MDALIIKQLDAEFAIARRHFSTLIGVAGARQLAPEKLKPLLVPSRGGRLTLHPVPASTLKSAADFVSNLRRYEFWIRKGISVVRDDWLLGGERRTAAADRIYAAATDLVSRDGLEAFDMDALAARVHCSRATIYRYAGGKAQIRDAVLLRLAARIVDSVRRAVKDLSGAERVVKAITVALEHIRSDPMRQMMIGLSAGRDLTELPSSPVLSRLAADLTGMTDDDPQGAQWIVRVVMSLAVWPIGDSEAEHQIVERFIAPAFN